MRCSEYICSKDSRKRRGNEGKNILITPKTGDDRSPVIWLLLGLGGGMAGAVWFLRKKGKEDQNQD